MRLEDNHKWRNFFNDLEGSGCACCKTVLLTTHELTDTEKPLHTSEQSVFRTLCLPNTNVKFHLSVTLTFSNSESRPHIFLVYVWFLEKNSDPVSEVRCVPEQVRLEDVNVI
jgi:hypothetical protein